MALLFLCTIYASHRVLEGLGKFGDNSGEQDLWFKCLFGTVTQTVHR